MNDYPVLTPVEQYPLHGWDYETTGYACQEGGVQTQFDWRCPDCVAIAETQDPETVVQWRQSAHHVERPVTLGWLVARSRALGVGK